MSYTHLAEFEGNSNGIVILRVTCGLSLRELPKGDTYWLPPRDAQPPGPVTCPDCRYGRKLPSKAGEPARLRMITVYVGTRDFPDEVVAIEVAIVAGQVQNGKIVARAPDYTACRKAILELNPTLHRLPRFPDDDPTIVEVWL